MEQDLKGLKMSKREERPIASRGKNHTIGSGSKGNVIKGQGDRGGGGTCWLGQGRSRPVTSPQADTPSGYLSFCNGMKPEDEPSEGEAGERN